VTRRSSRSTLRDLEPDGAVAIVLAAGAGSRLKSPRPKAFVPIGGTSMLGLSVSAAAACPDVEAVIVAVPEGWEGRAVALLPRTKPVEVVTGGATRQESVRIALRSVPAGVAAVACHDAARPFASPVLFTSVLAALVGTEAAIPVVPVSDTVKRVRDGWVVATEDRTELALAQTPQAFAAEPLRVAHERAAEAGLEFTDDAALMEWAGHRVRAIRGEPGNFKITAPQDLARATRLLGRVDAGEPRGAGEAAGG